MGDNDKIRGVCTLLSDCADFICELSRTENTSANCVHDEADSLYDWWYNIAQIGHGYDFGKLTDAELCDELRKIANFLAYGHFSAMSTIIRIARDRIKNATA